MTQSQIQTQSNLVFPLLFGVVGVTQPVTLRLRPGLASSSSLLLELEDEELHFLERDFLPLLFSKDTLTLPLLGDSLGLLLAMTMGFLTVALGVVVGLGGTEG